MRDGLEGLNEIEQGGRKIVAIQVRSLSDQCRLKRGCLGALARTAEYSRWCSGAFLFLGHENPNAHPDADNRREQPNRYGALVGLRKQNDDNKVED